MKLDEAVLPFAAVSVALPVATLMVIVPWFAGVMLAV